MRAVFADLTNEETGAEVIISGERAHHLQVVRIKIDEEILVLNGHGKRFFSKIIEINKKEVILKILNVEHLKLSHQINLALSLPKKDAFEDILKMTVELGVGNIYPLSSEFSQYDYVPSERINRLLESALVQSNNLYLPHIASQMTLDNYLSQEPGTVIYFSSTPNTAQKYLGSSGKVTVLIGPEGGFSKLEEEKILGTKNLKCIHLPTPILRAPTAVAASIGYLLHTID